MLARLIACSVGIEASLIALLLIPGLRGHVGAGIGCLLGASLFYLASVYLILNVPSPKRLTLRWFPVAMAVLFRLTLWTSFPAFSDDSYRYRWEGQLQSAGGNPYQVAPNDPDWARLRDSGFQRVVGKDFRAGYGPLTEALERVTYSAIAWFTPDPKTQVFWFKAPAALFDLGILALLWRMAEARWLLYAWCPLPVFEFWANGHNDAIAVFFIVLALFFADRRGSGLASSALWLAGAAKLWPLMLFPLLIVRREPGSWRRLGMAVLTAPVFLIWCVPFWSNVILNARFMSGFVGGWRNNDSFFGVFLWLARGDLYHAKLIAFGVLACAIVVVTALRLPLGRTFLCAIVALLLVSANCHPWYLTWFLPLLVFAPWPPLFLWIALMPLAYTVLFRWFGEGVWDGSTPVRWWIYGPVLACGVIWFWKRGRTAKPGLHPFPPESPRVP